MSNSEQVGTGVMARLLLLKTKLTCQGQHMERMPRPRRIERMEILSDVKKVVRYLEKPGEPG